MKTSFARHFFASLRNHAGLMFLTFLVTTGCFFVSGGLLLLGQNLQKILTLWGSSLQMSVYLQDDTGPEQIQQLQNFFRNDNRIASAKWIDRIDALHSFQDQMASYAPDLLNDAELLKFIPRSFQLKLSDKIATAFQLETMTNLAKELKERTEIQDVSFGQDWVKTYASVTSTVSTIGIWIITLLAAASIFVVSNAISSSIAQRKNEIEVLELVGASKGFIRTPFLVEGALVGVFSGFVALIILGSLFSIVRTELNLQASFLQIAAHLAFFPAWEIAFYLIAAIAIGSLSAFLSLRPLNDGWAASQLRQGGSD